MTQRSAPIPIAASALALSLLLASAGAAAQSLGSAFTYQGQLKETGQPASGLYDLQVCLFDTPSNPIPISCAADFNDVPVEAGLFAITLDFGAAPFVGQQRYIELRVRPGASVSGYTILAPRQLIRPAPEALRSNVAAAAPWSGLTGVPAGFADGTDNDSGGTVTSIATGTGLTGGPITGLGSIAVAAGGIGAAQINPAQVQSRVTGTCAAGMFVRSVNQDGTVICDPAGVGSITGVTAGTGLTGGGTSGAVTVGIAPGGVGAGQINASEVQARVTGSCTVGQYVRAVSQDGTVTCGTDANSGGSVTSIATGAGLAGGPITGAGTIAVAAGGIGATQINSAQVQARVVGTCPDREYLRGINADGSVNCSPISVPTLITTIDDPPTRVNNGTSIAIGSDNLPVISYWDSNQGALKVAKCSDAACIDPATITTLDNPPGTDVGGDTSIAVGTDGLPIISYDVFQVGALNVAKCSSAACTGAATITTVDNPPGINVVTYNSIAIGSDDIPVISYNDGTPGTLKVAKCANSACTGTATITTVDDPTENVGYYSSIAIGPDGAPIVSYFGQETSVLKVAKCGNAACTGIAVITTVDNVGGPTSIAIGADGLPIISYRDNSIRALKVAKCVNSTCTGNTTLTVVDDPVNGVGDQSSIAVGNDGFPVISYLDSDAVVLKVAKCRNAACTGGSTLTVVDDQSSGEPSAIAIGSDGLPVIGYGSRGGDGSLKVAKCGTPTCR